MKRTHYKPMSSWTGSDFRYYARCAGAVYINQLTRILKRSTSTLSAYANERIPIPLSVERDLLDYIKSTQAPRLTALQARLSQVLASATLVPARQLDNRAGNFERLTGYHDRAGKLKDPNDRTIYPPKWLTVRQAQLIRDALKVWAVEVHARAQRHSGIHLAECRLELTHIRDLQALAPRPDFVSQPLQIGPTSWRVLSRALRFHAKQSGDGYGHTFYNTLRKNLGVSKKLQPGVAPRPRPNSGVQPVSVPTGD